MQRFSESDVRNPEQLTRLLRSMSEEVERAHQRLDSHSQQLSGTIADKLTTTDLAAIRDALQSGGAAPLNLAKMPGILPQSQRGYAPVAVAVGGLPSPALYQVGTFGIITGPPAHLYYVVEGTPRTWSLLL